MLIERSDSEDYGSFPTLEEIKRDYNELVSEVKDIHTVKAARELEKKYKWLTIEINGDLLKDTTPDDTEVEWVRYDGYGCLAYIYVRTDGSSIAFDVWANAADFEFMDTVTIDDLDERYPKDKEAAEYYCKHGKWK